MNAALKTRLSNVATVLVSIIPAIQTSLTSPPLTQANIIFYGGILAFVSVVLTSAKQFLSAEVSIKAAQYTLLISLLPILAAVGNMIDVLHFADALKEKINWWVSLIAMIVTIVSKQLFPSQYQKENVETLKTIDQAKTQ